VTATMVVAAIVIVAVAVTATPYRLHIPYMQPEGCLTSALCTLP
jgi:hypothetical protein